MLVRRAKKFISNDGLSTFTFPTYNLMDQPKQTISIPTEATLGGDFSMPFNIASQNPIGNCIHPISFLMVSTANPPTALDLDSSLDTMFGTLFNGALGKLYTQDDNSVERWAWAAVKEISAPYSPESRYTIPVTVTFERVSHWFISQSGSATITVSGQTFVIANPGQVSCYNGIFTLAPIAASPLATNPSFTFSSAPTLPAGLPYFAYSTAAGTAMNATTRRLKVDSGNALVQVSTNSGSTYTDDYAHLTRQTGQAMFSQLIPGNNTITVGDGATPHYTFSWTFDAPYLR